MIKKEILCTLGPSSRNPRVMARLEDLGVNLFRINLSHTKPEDVAQVIRQIQNHSTVPVCLDTQGAQIRTGSLKEGVIQVETNDTIRIAYAAVEGDAGRFNLYPAQITAFLEIGDILSIDFNSVLVQVIEKDDEGVIVRTITGGTIGKNKAVTLDRDIEMPPLTQEDKEAIRIGLAMGIKHVALSFANRGQDVDELRSLVGKDVFLISKIESINGIKNLAAIADRSNAILIDRGDMSRQLPIEQIPRAQKVIIRRAKEYGAKVYVATNLLESMVTRAAPTRAEVNDIFNTLVDGADGLVLAAETAIGKYPIQSALMVSKVMEQYLNYSNGKIFSIEDYRSQGSLLMSAPHGGELVNRIAEGKDHSAETYKRLYVDQQTLIDAEQIAIGSYSPLKGFMGREEMDSVVERYCLPSGVVWPLPVTLQISEDEVRDLKEGDRLALAWEEDQSIYATMTIREIFNYDVDRLAKEIYHTTEETHPGVERLKRRGKYFIAGEIELLKRLSSPDKHFELTPLQARKIFENKGWQRIVAFHTRNVAHRVHEFIQLKALEDYHCDGLFIHPLVGPKKAGDYSAQIVLKSYEILVRNFYPKESVVLAAFQSYPRYAGPREAVFTALCRKNFGCSHFIVGRDHSGVGGYYEPDASHRLFKELGDIGIKPIFFNEYKYCLENESYVEVTAENMEALLSISGTDGRALLQQKKEPPEWFMRRDITRFIIDEIDKGFDVFSS